MYITKQGMRETTDQVMEAIGAVKTAVEGKDLRIDRMWESHGKPAPPHPPIVTVMLLLTG